MGAFVRHLVVLLVAVSSTGTLAGKSRHEILEDLTGKNYDSRVSPNFDDDVPTNVTVSLFVLNFDSVTEEAMEYSITIFLHQTWLDPRLRWQDDIISGKLEVDPKIMDQVWIPDAYFSNEKTARMHEITMPNRQLHIYENGTVYYSIRISMTLGCDMYLRKYPMDEQKCSLYVGSYSFSKENLVFRWDETPVMLRRDLTLPHFEVLFKEVKTCNMANDKGSQMMKNYSCIQADFSLRREFGYYLTDIYFPTFMLVIVSWVSFWIDAESTPARVSLGLLTVLSMTTQTTGAKTGMPKVSYVKAIDVWFSVCMLFVFAALLEFAYVNVRSRVIRRRKAAASMKQKDSEAQVTEEGDSCNLAKDVTFTKKSRFFTNRAIEEPHVVDKWSRIAFPVSFLLFNVIYWLYYSVIH